MSEKCQLQTRAAQKDRYSITSLARPRSVDAERLDLREHRNATGLQPGGLQWVVISGVR